MTKKKIARKKTRAKLTARGADGIGTATLADGRFVARLYTDSPGGRPRLVARIRGSLQYIRAAVELVEIAAPGGAS